MTDTKAPAPWLEVVKGLMPSLNQCLIVIVTAVAAFYTAKATNPPPPAPRVVEVVKTVPDAGSTMQRLAVIESKLDQMLAAKSAAKRVVTSTKK